MKNWFLPFLLGLCFAVSAFGSDPNLVAYFPFNGNADDASGNGHNGAVTGATLTEDRFGNPASAYSFNGSSDLITVANHADLNITGPLTVSAWVKSAPLYANFKTIVTKGNVSSRNYELQVIYAGADLPSQVCWLYTTGGISKWWMLGDDEYADDNWHYLGGTWVTNLYDIGGGVIHTSEVFNIEHIVYNWETVPGRLYHIYTRANLTDAAGWDPVYSVSGSGGTCSYTNATDMALKFYKLGVEMEP